MTLLITGIRYFAIGPDFMALGKHYQYASLTYSLPISAYGIYRHDVCACLVAVQ